MHESVLGTKDEFAATQKNGPVLGVLLTPVGAHPRASGTLRSAALRLREFALSLQRSCSVGVRAGRDGHNSSGGIR